jgi:signal transduction histidine kinase
LFNSLKFTPQVGKIQLQLSNTANYAQIQVSDTGVGIFPEFLPHVFDRFRQEDGSMTRKQSGLKFGLVIARHLVV